MSTEGASAPNAYLSGARTFLIKILEQWLILGLGLAILLAYLFPDVGKTGGAIRAEYTVKYGCIGVIFFITGITLSTRALVKQAANWRLHLVTQGISFIIFSAVVYAIVWIVMASGTHKIDLVVMSGLVTMGVLPTTIASNVAMTRNANGNVEAATIEVCVGNVLGTFLTPSLLIMYIQPLQKYGFIQPQSSGGDGLGAIYSHMGQQLGISLFAPLIVGQVIQNIWPELVKLVRERLRVNIIGQILMLILIWSTFCSKFATGVFKIVTPETIIMMCFLNIGLYVAMTGVCLFVARPPFVDDVPEDEKHPGEQPRVSRLRMFMRSMKFDRRQTAAICFCGAAKGLVLGTPLISIMYSAYDEEVQSSLSLPIALYQGTQIALAQLMVKVVRRWVENGDREVGVSDVETRSTRELSQDEGLKSAGS